jgi:cell division protein FtsQ
MRKRVSQSTLRVRKNRFQRYSQHFFRDLGICTLIVTAAILMTSGLIYGYTYILSDPYFQIRETVIRGCREVTEKEVLALASLHPQQNIFSVRTDKLARQIERNPWIKDAYVGRELPDRLIMEIRERIPLALVEKKQSIFIVDREGVIFKVLGHNDNLDLPVITGYEKNGTKLTKLMKKSLELLTHLSDTKQAPITYQNLSEVHLDEIFGLSLVTDTGLCLVLGFDDFGNKLRALPAVMEGLSKKNIDMALLHIDLRDPAKITVQSKAKTVPPQPPVIGKEYRT